MVVCVGRSRSFSLSEEMGGRGGWPELRLSETEAAGGGGGGGGWQDTGGPSCPSAPSSPTSDHSLSFGSDYYEFACQLEESEAAAVEELAGAEEAKVAGARSQERELGGTGSLSFRTCSSAPSSPLSFRSVSVDWGEFPPMSEQEEVASRRWLLALESHDTGDSHLPPVTFPQQNEEKSSLRWFLPPFLRHRFSPAAESDGGGGSWRSGSGKYPLLWYRDLGQYAFGNFSMAVVQANHRMEDQCQIESWSFGAFVGIYDGHGGPEAARYVCDHLYRNFREISSGPFGVTYEAIERAFLQTDEGFNTVVAEQWESNSRLATVGSCCLAGVICHGTLYVANAGDSRVVLGTKSRDTGEIAATQLSTEHNVNLEAVRKELREQNPHDPEIVILKHGVWRIKGIIMISRSIGDVYMKHAEYNREPLPAMFRVSGPLNMPILSAKPSITSHPLHINDSFLIFASDGLWEHLSNEEAVKIVHDHPHAGSARRLIEVALRRAASKREIKYTHLQRIDRGIRRHFHDDISVVVLFLNHDLIGGGPNQVPSLSINSNVLNLDRT